eukprot:scaffold2018_cov113-Cylindrotheca_fusiformis.AAC.8
MAPIRTMHNAPANDEFVLYYGMLNFSKLEVSLDSLVPTFCRHTTQTSHLGPQPIARMAEKTNLVRTAGTFEYPHCEHYAKNMSEIEVLFHNSSIPYYSNNPVNNWAKPGDCQRFQNIIVTEKLGFNGYPFEECDDL